MRERIAVLKQKIEVYFTSDVLSFKDLMRILLPIAWEQAFLVVLAVVSIWMMSFDGTNAVSVVNMMNVVNKVFTSICLGFVTGGTVLVAQNIGAKRPEAACRSMVQAMGFVVLLTTALGGVLIALRTPLVAYLLDGAEAEIVTEAVRYFIGFCVSFPFYALYQSFAGGMRGWGKTKLAWRLILSVNCADLGLTALFVLILKMGVFGITLAMAISRIGGAVCAVVMMARERRELNLRLRAYLKPSPAIIRGILIIAVPLALEQFFFNGGKAVSQRFIASYGTLHMAANGVVNAIFDLFNLPQATLRETAVTVIGICIGAGRTDLARRYILKFLRTIRRLLVYLMPLTLPLAALMIWAYGLSTEANQLVLWSLALIFTFGPLFLAGSFTLPSGLRAGGDAAFVSLSTLCCMWGVRVTLSYLFCRVLHMGVVGINLAMVIEWMFRNALFRIRLKGSVWCSHKLIGEA